jgi:hypothetical protein
MKRIIKAFGLILMFCMLAISLAACQSPVEQNVIYQTLPSDPNDPGTTNDDPTWQDIYQANIRSVPMVAIFYCWRYTGYNDSCYEIGHGTGFVLNDNVVATNWHVAESYFDLDLYGLPDSIGYYKLMVRYPASNALAGNEFLLDDYEVTGVYTGLKDYDLALLRVNTLGRQPVKLNPDSWQQLEVLQEVMTLGYPQEFLFFATTGEINQTRLNGWNFVPWMASDTPLILMDAQTDRGNSGGPLFNKKGEVIGINSAGYLPDWIVYQIAIAVDPLKRVDYQGQSVVFETREVPEPADYRLTTVLTVTSELNPLEEYEENIQYFYGNCLYRIDVSGVSMIDTTPVTPVSTFIDLFQNGMYQAYGSPDYLNSNETHLVWQSEDDGFGAIYIGADLYYSSAPGWYYLQVDQYCR